MTTLLDWLLSRRSQNGWVCPKCEHAMVYTPMFSSAYYVCGYCHWMQRATPMRGTVRA